MVVVLCPLVHWEVELKEEKEQNHGKGGGEWEMLDGDDVNDDDDDVNDDEQQSTTMNNNEQQ